MHVMTLAPLRDFWRSRPGDPQADSRMRAWYKLTEAMAWADFGGLQQTFRATDKVGDCFVFDVGGNHDRIIAKVHFARSIVFIKRVMDHKEYDRNLWPDQCGCHEPHPPRKSRSGAAASPRDEPGGKARKKGGSR